MANKTEPAQHTPGPWEVVAINAEGWPLPTRTEYPNADVSFGIVKESGAVITEGEIDANARLIAAAPDLLNALEVLRDIILCDHSWTGPFQSEACKTISAAIAKAEGR